MRVAPVIKLLAILGCSLCVAAVPFAVLVVYPYTSLNLRTPQRFTYQFRWIEEGMARGQVEHTVTRYDARGWDTPTTERFTFRGIKTWYGLHHTRHHILVHYGANGRVVGAQHLREYHFPRRARVEVAARMGELPEEAP